MAFWKKDSGKDASETQDPSGFIARKEYAKAIQAYRAQITAQPKNYILNHKVADVLCLAGREKESLQDYSIAADGYAREGFLIKAIAILKKLQKLDPGNSSTESRLAELSSVGSSSSSLGSSGGFGSSSPGSFSNSKPGEMASGPELSLDMEMIEEGSPVPPPPPADEIELADSGPPTSQRVALTPLFSEFSPEELGAVVSRLRHHSFSAGSALVSEGAPGDSLFVLSQGRVRVTTRGPKGDPVELAELKEGDFFGEVSLLTGKPRTATITSTEETEVLELTRDDLMELEKAHPRIREVIQEFYQRRVASTVESMIRAARGSSRPGPGEPRKH